MNDVKYISNLISGEDIYYLKDAEARTNLADKISKEEYAEGVVVDSTRYYTVTGAEKEYWNSKVNPPSYSAPTAKQLTYTGEAQDLLNPGSSTIGNIQYSTDETNWSTTVPQATNAGTYTVYWRFVGSELVYIDSTAINVTIAKANPTYTAPTAKTLTYNGNAQDLINAGSTSDGTISYSEDGENWSSSVPSKTNAGNYAIYWKLDGGTNYNSIASTAINVSIAKVTPTVVVPTAKTGLTYNTQAQELLNAGSANWGTLQYSLDNEAYGTSIPSGTNAGDYTVYYKVVGDDNINGVAAQSVSCSIGKANRSASFSGNETSLAVGETNTIYVVTTGSPTITLLSSNTDVATVSGMIITAIGGGATTITATIASDTNYNSTSISYTLKVPYPNGVYAAYSDGSMRTTANADTNAIGVAVITDDCKFIIDKTNDTRNKAWDSQLFTNGVIAGCTTVNSNPQLDFDGASNTDAIASVTNGGEAAKYCRSKAITIDGVTKQGYLGACGELYAMFQNKTDVDTMMTAIGGTAFSTNYYWSSTQYDFTTAWDIDNNNKQNDWKDGAYYNIRPFYPLD